MAHQLKSPLTSIIGHIELLEEALDQPGQAGPDMTVASLPVIARGAERIRETVDALLTLSKVQLAHRPLIPGCVPLATLVSECADLLGAEAPFHRSTSPEALAEPGTGLGMTIVKAVVDRHLGHIDVDSEPGVGTTLRVWLPAPPR